MTNRLMNIQEAASLLGVKKSTLYAWVNQRKLPCFKIGRLLKFDVQKLGEWISEQERPAEELQVIPLRFKSKPYKYIDMKSQVISKGKGPQEL